MSQSYSERANVAGPRYVSRVMNLNANRFITGIMISATALVFGPRADAQQVCDEAVLAAGASLEVHAIAVTDELAYVSQRREDEAPWEVVGYRADGSYEIIQQFHPTSIWRVTHLVALGEDVIGVASPDCSSSDCTARPFLFRLRNGYLESLGELDGMVTSLVADHEGVWWVEMTGTVSAIRRFDVVSGKISSLVDSSDIQALTPSNDAVYFIEEGVVRRLDQSTGEVRDLFCCGSDLLLDHDEKTLYIETARDLGNGSSRTLIIELDLESGTSETFQRARGTNFGIAFESFDLLAIEDGVMIVDYRFCSRSCRSDIAVATRAGLTIRERSLTHSIERVAVGECSAFAFFRPSVPLPSLERSLERVGLGLPVILESPLVIVPGELATFRGRNLSSIDSYTISIEGVPASIDVVRFTDEEIQLRIRPERLGAFRMILSSLESASIVVPVEFGFPRRRAIRRD